MKSIIHAISKKCYDPAFGLFILRIVTGFIFVNEGWQKFRTIHATESLMLHLGLPMSMAVIIATIELVGGLALVLGIFTRIWGIVFCIEMIVIIFLTGWSRGIGSHNLELILAAGLFALVFAGSRKYSLYPGDCRICGGMFCKTHITDNV